MNLEATCTHCKKVFPIKYKREANKFCSRECYFAELAITGRPGTEAKRVEFTCAHCEQPFSFAEGQLRAYRKNWGQDPKYCSRACSHIGRTHKKTRACEACGKKFYTQGHSLNRTRTCSEECRRELQARNLLSSMAREYPPETREIQFNTTAQGYVRMRFPNPGDGTRGREVLQHRYVMEQHLGRELRPNETVHHVNGVRNDNRLENLELFDSRHGPGQRVTDQVNWCVTMLSEYPEFLRAAGYELVKIADQATLPNVSRT